MDRPLTTLFVVPNNNTLPTTTDGTVLTADLDETVGQFGVFNKSGIPVTNSTIGTNPFMFAQGRLEDVSRDGMKLGTKKSPLIYPSKVKNFYKIISEDTVRTQITKLSAFGDLKCEENYSLTLRVRENMADNAFAPSIGLTKTLTIKTPCCDCGGDPCATLDAAAVEAVIDELITKGNGQEDLARYLTFSKEMAIKVADASTFQVDEAVTSSTGTGTGTVISADTTTDVVVVKTSSLSTTFTGNLTPAAGAASAISTVSDIQLVITAKTPTNYGANTTDFFGSPYEYNFVYFVPFFYKAAETSQDFIIPDACENLVTVTTTQEPTFPRGAAAEIKLMEKRFHSYQSDFKTLYCDGDYNGAFSSYVDSSWYDTYVIEAEYVQNNPFSDDVPMNFWTWVAVPTGTNSTLVTMLTTALGAPVNASPADIS